MSYDPFAITKNAAKTKENPSSRQLSILSLVCVDKKHESVDFYARELQINKPAVSRNIDRLEKLGMVNRTKNPTDHRKIIITATDIGQQYIQSIQQQ